MNKNKVGMHIFVTELNVKLMCIVSRNSLNCIHGEHKNILLWLEFNFVAIHVIKLLQQRGNQL